MIIYTSDIKADGDDIGAIMAEIEAMPEVMEYIRSHHLRGGDFIESIAATIASDNDADLDEHAVYFAYKDNPMRSFTKDTGCMFDLLTNKELENDAQKQDILHLVTDTVPTRKNLEKLIQRSLPGSNYKFISVVGSNILNGEYKNEFRFTYHEVTDIKKISTTSELFSLVRQALTYFD